jgi:hypothetical protein
MPIAEPHHITQIHDTHAELMDHLDNDQIGIEIYSNYMAYRDDGGVYHLLANQGEPIEFTDITADDIEITTGHGLIITDMTEGSILFVGANGLVSQHNDKLFWDDTNNILELSAIKIGTLAGLLLGTAGTVSALAPVLGDLVYGAAGPVWGKLGIQPAGSVLISGATPAWSPANSVFIDSSNRISFNYAIDTNIRFNVNNAASYTSVAFTTFSSGAADHCPLFRGRRARGTYAADGALTATNTGDTIFYLYGEGANSSGSWATGGYFKWIQNGAAGATRVPTDIEVYCAGVAGVYKNLVFSNTGHTHIPGDGQYLKFGTNLNNGIMALATYDNMQFYSRLVSGTGNFGFMDGVLIAGGNLTSNADSAAQLVVYNATRPVLGFATTSAYDTSAPTGRGSTSLGDRIVLNQNAYGKAVISVGDDDVGGGFPVLNFICHSGYLAREFPTMRFYTGTYNGGLARAWEISNACHLVAAANNIYLKFGTPTLTWGAGTFTSPAGITYDGTNLLINPQLTGSGATVFTGSLGIGGTPTVPLHVFGAALITTTLGITGLSTLTGGMIAGYVKMGTAAHVDEIWNDTDDNDTGGVWINWKGYNAGTTRYRKTILGNGKGAAVLTAQGALPADASVRVDGIILLKEFTAVAPPTAVEGGIMYLDGEFYACKDGANWKKVTTA